MYHKFHLILTMIETFFVDCVDLSEQSRPSNFIEAPCGKISDLLPDCIVRSLRTGLEYATGCLSPQATREVGCYHSWPWHIP